MRDVIRQLFPNLRDEDLITSPPDVHYNCVAWAAGDTERWWWPAETPYSFWPAGVTRDESIASFIAAFSTLGYEPTVSGNLESEYEKLAIFAANDGLPTHMARQLVDGMWTSKLGSLEDIAHVDLNGVSGSDYGQVVAILRRPALR